MTHRGPFQPLPFCHSVILWGALPCCSAGLEACRCWHSSELEHTSLEALPG